MESAPDDVVAWIGPGIGPRAFEVGRDVVDAFVAVEREDADCFAPLREGKWLADLPELARRRLARAGLRWNDGIHGGDWCTVTDAGRFHSHRRDRVGRPHGHGGLEGRGRRPWPRGPERGAGRRARL